MIILRKLLRNFPEHLTLSWTLASMFSMVLGPRESHIEFGTPEVLYLSSV